MEVGAEVAWLGMMVGHRHAASRSNQLTHRRSIGGDHHGTTAHRLDDVVSPSLGERRTEVDAVGVEVGFDFLVRDVIGDQLDVGRNAERGIFFTLDDGEQRPLGVFLPELENRFRALERAASCEMEEGLVVGLDGFIQ